MRRDSYAAHAERLANAELREAGRRVTTIGLHPEEHGHSFVDGETAKPVVRAAPGSERRDGEWKIRWHSPAEVAQNCRVKRTLRQARVKVDLQSGDIGIPNAVKNEVCGLPLKARCNGTRSFDAHDGDALDAGRVDNRLAARNNSCNVAEEDGAVERGDGRGLRVERSEIFWALPDPERVGGECVHAAGRGRKVGCVGLEGETEEAERDKGQRLPKWIGHGVGQVQSLATIVQRAAVVGISLCKRMG